jgi:CRP/FNR family transcriptional regulator, cyclic AMP receptor protein
MKISFGMQLLRSIPLFQELNETECRQIAEVIQMNSFAAGQTVIRQGESSRNLWVMLEGTCNVVKRMSPEGPRSESIVLAALEPYNYFGEMSFFHPAPHSADVVAKTNVKLLRISHVDYQDLIAEGVWAAYKLSHNVVQELADRLRRMDDWVSELLLRQKADGAQAEWSEFRNKLFGGWNS